MSFRNTGTKMGSMVKDAGSAVSRGATQAASTVKEASTETRYRLNDMREQLHEKQSGGKVPRTDAKFKADVGNGAEVL
jgi:hypothetical protein